MEMFNVMTRLAFGATLICAALLFILQQVFELN